MVYSNQVDGCPVWIGYPGVGYWVQDDLYVEHSPRAGGKYRIPRVMKWRLEDLGLEDSHKARLTTRLIDQRRMGIDWPWVSASLVEEAKNAPLLPVQDRADRLIRFIADQAVPVSVTVRVEQDTYGAYAWSESIQWHEIRYLLDYLTESGWIQPHPGAHEGFNGTVTVAGHRRIEEQKTNFDSSQAFVAMWFDPSMDKHYEDGFKLAIRAAGYVPLRIDKKHTLGKLDDEIIAEIRRSRFLVADFTHGDKGARGSVYFEAGFAHSLGIPVIYTCHKDNMDDLHFDTRQYPHIVWETPEELRKQLQDRIMALLGEGPRKGEG